MEPLTSAWVQSDVEYSPFPDPYCFGRCRQRYLRTVEAAAAAETPAIYRRDRRKPCPHHHCHPRCHHRFRVRHHRRHPCLNDLSLPKPRTGRPTLASLPPPPTSMSKARRRRSRHRRRRHRPATILAASADAAELCDVWEGRNGASIPV